MSQEDVGKNWADCMSDQERENHQPFHHHDSELDAPRSPCDTLVSAFPVPGEVWCHLFTVANKRVIRAENSLSFRTANYYSAVLTNHPPPKVGETRPSRLCL